MPRNIGRLDKTQFADRQSKQRGEMVTEHVRQVKGIRISLPGHDYQLIHHRHLLQSTGELVIHSSSERYQLFRVSLDWNLYGRVRTNGDRRTLSSG